MVSAFIFFSQRKEKKKEIQSDNCFDNRGRKRLYPLGIVVGCKRKKKKKKCFVVIAAAALNA